MAKDFAMELRRFVRLIFLFFLTFSICWTHNSWADEPPATTPDGNEQVSCEFDDEQKKQLAERANTEAIAAYNKIKEISDIIQRDFKADDGPCHYLDNSWFWEDGEWGAHEIKYPDTDIKGAETADSLINKTTTKTAVENTNDSKLKDYTDWNFAKLRQRAYSKSATAAQIANWAPTAKPGDKFKVDSEVKKNICKQVNCSYDTFQNDCDYIVKLDKKGTFACMDQGMGSNDIITYPDEGQTLAGFGKVVKVEHSEYDVDAGRFGTMHVVFDKCAYSNARGVTWECGAVQYDPDDVAKKWSNMNEMLDAIVDPETKKCEESLAKAEANMGEADVVDSFLGHRKRAHEALVLLSGELECSCEKDAAGEIHGTCKDDEFEENQDLSKCKSLAMYQEELAGFCITCKLFASIMSAVQNISQQAFDTTADSLSGLLIIAFLIYIGYVTLITIASPEAQKISKYLTTLTLQGFKVAIAILILKTPTFLYPEIINPILDGSVDFSISLLGEHQGKVEEMGKKYSSSFNQRGEYFSAKTAQNMVGAVENFSNAATLMPAIGRALMCRAFDDLGIDRAWIVPRVGMLIEGCILYVFGLGILLAIGFYMLDCAIELGLVFALMAFFVACWPFKLTSNYTKIGWNMFLNVFFNFVMMSVIIMTIVRLSAQSLAVGTSLDELQALLNSDMVDALEQAIDIGGLQMIMVIVCCLICFKLPKESGRLANKFAGGAQVAMGGDLGGLAARAVTNTVGRAARVAANVAAPGLKIAANLAIDNSGIKDGLKKMTAKTQNTMGKLGIGGKARMGAKGRNPNANQQGPATGGFLPDK